MSSPNGDLRHPPPRILPLPDRRDGLTALWELVSVRWEVGAGPDELGVPGKAPRKRWALSLAEKAFTATVLTWGLGRKRHKC